MPLADGWSHRTGGRQPGPQDQVDFKTCPTTEARGVARRLLPHLQHVRRQLVRRSARQSVPSTARRCSLGRPPPSSASNSAPPTYASLLPADLDGSTAPPAGSPNYLVGTTAPANDFSLSLSPTSLPLAPGGSGTSTVSTTTTNGSAQLVVLSASGLPVGATASFNPSSVMSGGSSTLTVATSDSTPPGTYSIAVTGTGSATTHSATVTLTVPASTSVTNGGFGSTIQKHHHRQWWWSEPPSSWSSSPKPFSENHGPQLATRSSAEMWAMYQTTRSLPTMGWLSA